MYRIQNLHRSQQLLLLTTWLERFTLRICFLNALRLARNIYKCGVYLSSHVESQISNLKPKICFQNFQSDDRLVRETPSYNSINFYPFHLQYLCIYISKKFNNKKANTQRKKKSYATESNGKKESSRMFFSPIQLTLNETKN